MRMYVAHVCELVLHGDVLTYLKRYNPFCSTQGQRLAQIEPAHEPSRGALHVTASIEPSVIYACGFALQRMAQLSHPSTQVKDASRSNKCEQRIHHPRIGWHVMPW